MPSSGEGGLDTASALTGQAPSRADNFGARWADWMVKQCNAGLGWKEWAGLQRYLMERFDYSSDLIRSTSTATNEKGWQVRLEVVFPLAADPVHVLKIHRGAVTLERKVAGSWPLLVARGRSGDRETWLLIWRYLSNKGTISI